MSNISADIDRYLLASRRNESIIYRIGEVFEEIRRSEFNRKGGTIAAGRLLGGALWAQVVPGEIRVYDNGMISSTEAERRNKGTSTYPHYG